MSEKINDDINRKIQEAAEVHTANFTSLTTIEGLIIRGHILIEFELNNAIKRSAFLIDEYNDERFSFSQKARMCYMMGVANEFKTEINILNKLRNEIAHTLKYDKKQIEIIIKGINKKTNDKINTDNLELGLQEAISYICGSIFVSKNMHKEALDYLMENKQLNIKK